MSSMGPILESCQLNEFGDLSKIMSSHNAYYGVFGAGHIEIAARWQMMKKLDD